MNNTETAASAATTRALQRDYPLLSETGLVQLMQRLAPQLRNGGVIYLQGDLGAGKTVAARALIQALGYSGRVKSPTYALLEIYTLQDLRVMHLDLYRMAAASEVIDLGLEDSGEDEKLLLLVEWPEKGTPYLPSADLSLILRVHGDKRHLQMSAHGLQGAQLIAPLPKLIH